MFEGPIVAEAEIAPRDIAGAAEAGGRGHALLGLALLLLMLPWWTARLLAWALWRDARRVARFAALIGAAAGDARRQP